MRGICQIPNLLISCTCGMTAIVMNETVHSKNDNPETFNDDHYIINKVRKWTETLFTRVGKKRGSK